MIVMDSGLGGISVVRELRAARPDLPLIYIADTAGFPYGKRTVDDITRRATQMVGQLQGEYAGSCVVIACNTISTLCLDALRAGFTVPFVGTVPAIKTAASVTKSRRFTLLATPNTAHSRYSSGLIAQFASHCMVDIYGAPNLAAIAERMMLGEKVSPELIRAELKPAFFDDARGKTDCVVLGCTHYPLVVDALKAASPWKVTFVDSGEAIARRALALANVPVVKSVAYVTDAGDVARYAALFRAEGFEDVRVLELA